MRFAGLSEIFQGHPQHAKALTVFLVEVLVVHFVGFADGGKVGVLGVSEPTEPPVNEYVVNQKVAESIGGDACAYPKPEITINAACDKAPSTGNGENQKEGVVLFEESGLVLVVIAVEIPHDAVHQVFVRSPCHPFHDKEGHQYNQEGSQDFHGNSDSPIKNAV